MSFIMRSLVCNKIIQAVSGFPIGGRGIKPSDLLPFVKVCPQNKPTIEYELDLRANPSNESRYQRSLPREILSFDLAHLIKKVQTDDTITAIYADAKSSSKVKLKVSTKKVITEVLNLVCNRPETFWKSSALFTLSPKQKVVVEFSSPNIAKPFHMGHLRSTIVGNFISNLHLALDHEVIKINYLGDWGTQFGLLKHGYDLKKLSEEDLMKDPIKSLYNLYVWINAEAEKSDEIRDEAKAIFNLMEKGDQEHLKAWLLFRNLSIQDFKKTYRRLNVSYDLYHGESMYQLKESNKILRLMEEKGLLTHLQDGRKQYKWRAEGPGLTIVKSDGSTMYLTRDIAAAIQRRETFKFDKMYYVVDNSQHHHFESLIRILNDLELDWAKNLEHIKFGRIQGMSTRKGTAIFLEDVLDESRDLMCLKQKQSKNTQFDDPSKTTEIADIVGASAIMIADLKRRRMKDYTFSWESALQSNGDTGVRLQYSHCRLVRLEKNCGVSYKEEVNFESLVEPEAINVVRQIARFDEVLFQTFQNLEACTLANYLFELSNLINKAFKNLPVKTASPEVAADRLKLFRASRLTLAAGMKILGLQPLEQM